MQIERANLNTEVKNLPDGSKVIVDPGNERVYALNATAGAAWDACAGPTTLSRVAEDMRRSFDPGITEDIAEEAILQLQQQSLVSTSASSGQPSRRKLLVALGAIALPVVVSLTMTQQRAYAAESISTNDPPAYGEHKPHHEHKNSWW